MTLSDRPVDSPISVIDSDDVFEARIAWPGVTSSSSANTACLIFIRSGTASITKSTSPKPSYSVVPWMRPRIAAACSSACSWVIFSFFTRRASWPFVTSLAFSSPVSMNFCSTSFSTTSTSAEASTWAISPPMVPAPTTAALNTNIWSSSEGDGARRQGPSDRGGRLQSRLLRRLRGEPAQRAGERVVLGAADEEHVDEGPERAADRHLVVELELHDRALVLLICREGHPLGAVELLLEHVHLVLSWRQRPPHALGHGAATAWHAAPDELRALVWPRIVDAIHTSEAVDEGWPAGDV